MTTMKSILLAAALGLSSLTFATAATYNFQLASPANAGAAKLDAGSYKLNLNGRIAVFTNVETSKSVMVFVREGSAGQRLERTALELKNENGVDRLESIELEDSSNTLEF
jgi:hypothetical protein